MKVVACITMLMLSGCAAGGLAMRWDYPQHQSCGVVVCQSRVGKIDPKRDCYCSHKNGNQVLDEMRR